MRLFDYFFGWRKLDIKKNDLVLEVGNGGSPMVRSNILVDKYINNNCQREIKLVIDDRPLICAEVENLPFKCDSFNFVYASHIIEHISKVEDAIAEITRVGKAGLIIVPGEIYERAWDKNTHRWIINENKGKLIFRKKCDCTKLKRSDTFDKWKKIFWKIYVKNRSLLDIHLSWKNHIAYEIIECEGCHELEEKTSDYYELNANQMSFKAKCKQEILIQLSKIIRLIFYKNIKKDYEQDF